MKKVAAKRRSDSDTSEPSTSKRTLSMRDEIATLDCPRRERDLVHHNSPTERSRSRKRISPVRPYQSPPQTRPRPLISVSTTPRHVSRAVEDEPRSSSRGATTPMSPMPPQERPVCLVRGAVYIEDFVEVTDLVGAGNTITSTSATTSFGGKGAMQAIGISRAGQRVELVAAIGRDGDFIPSFLSSFGVGILGCKFPQLADDAPPVSSGRSITQFTPQGQRARIIVPGANVYAVDSAKDILLQLQQITHLLVQNEIDPKVTHEYIDTAYLQGIPVIINPSPLPFDRELSSFPWHKITYLILTERDADVFVQGLKRLCTKFCPTQPIPSIHADARIAAGLVPPVPPDSYNNLVSLIQWPPLSQTGIVIKLDAVGGGALAVLPSARGPSSKIFYEPAPPREVAFTGRGSIGDGCIDTVAGYFVAGVMEFALFDRFHMEDHMWQVIMEKAVVASFMTPTSYPPSPPLPVDAVPHFQDVQKTLTHLNGFYLKQLQSHTSLRPYPSANTSDSERKSPDYKYYPRRASTSHTYSQ